MWIISIIRQSKPIIFDNLADKSKKIIVKEFIQKEFNSHNLFEQFKILISDPKYLINYNDKIQKALNDNKFENLNVELIIDYLKKSSLTIKD